MLASSDPSISLRAYLDVLPPSPSLNENYVSLDLTEQNIYFPLFFQAYTVLHAAYKSLHPPLS
jgi:hypothetical protein